MSDKINFYITITGKVKVFIMFEVYLVDLEIGKRLNLMEIL